MIKKQVSWQLEKFELSADFKTGNVYPEVRNDVRALQKEGWEVISQESVGYNPATGNVIVLIGLVKYEWIPEPTEAPVAKKSKTAEEKK